MPMKGRRLNPVVRAIVALALLGLSASPASAGSSNKWRIEVSEGANSDGEIVFQVTPDGGEAIEIRVAVKDGTRENKVAETISNALAAQLPADRYNVEVDDGEDVLVKKKGGADNFDLTLVSSTVKSVRIDIEKE